MLLARRNLTSIFQNRCIYILNIFGVLNKMTTKTTTYEEMRDRLDSLLNQFVATELHRERRCSREISPLQMREWDRAVGTIAHVIRQVIKQNEKSEE